MTVPENVRPGRARVVTLTGWAGRKRRYRLRRHQPSSTPPKSRRCAIRHRRPCSLDRRSSCARALRHQSARGRQAYLARRVRVSALPGISRARPGFAGGASRHDATLTFNAWRVGCFIARRPAGVLLHEKTCGLIEHRLSEHRQTLGGRRSGGIRELAVTCVVAGLTRPATTSCCSRDSEIGCGNG